MFEVGMQIIIFSSFAIGLVWISESHTQMYLELLEDIIIFHSGWILKR